MAGRWVLDGGSDQRSEASGALGKRRLCGSVLWESARGGDSLRILGEWSLVTDAAHERSRTSTSFPIRF